MRWDGRAALRDHREALAQEVANRQSLMSYLRDVRGVAPDVGDFAWEHALAQITLNGVLQLIRRNAWLRQYYERLEPRANRAKSQSSPRCASYSSPCGASRFIGNPSCRCCLRIAKVGNCCVFSGLIQRGD